MKKRASSLIKLLLVLALVFVLLPQRVEAAEAGLSGSGTVQAGSTVKLTLSVSGSNIMGVTATLDYDSSRWTYGDDGYYYYNEPLAAGETTGALFRNVSFDPAMGNMYQDSKAVIKVSAQAVQVKNNGSDVFTAAGWPDVEK